MSSENTPTMMVIFSSWRKPSFPGPETLFISLGGILRHICFYRKSETTSL